jgi:predicted ester cyclase
MEITVDRVDENKALMQKIVQIFETGDLSSAAAVIDTEYIDHQGLDGIALKGIDGFCHVVKTARIAFIELRISIEDLIGEEDRVVGRLRWYSTRSNGEVIHRETIDIVRFANCRAVEHWGAYVSATERSRTDAHIG